MACVGRLRKQLQRGENPHGRGEKRPHADGEVVFHLGHFGQKTKLKLSQVLLGGKLALGSLILFLKEAPSTCRPRVC